MRVLHVGIASPAQQSGGLNRFVADLSRAQALAGADPIVLALGSGTPVEREFRFVAPAEGLSLRRIAAFRRAIRRGTTRAAVLDVHFAWNAVTGLLGRPRPRRLVVHFHGPWGAEAASDGAHAVTASVKRAIEGWVYRRADVCIVLTQAFKTVLASEYAVSDSKIAVIPPGVDTVRFAPGDRTTARVRLGLPTDARIVLAVRRLVPRMGLDDLVEAMAEIDALLVLVGRGPLAEALRSQAESAGVGDRVVLRQDVSDGDLADHYRAADLSVVPSRALEGFGLVALESLACGTPVVARAQGGLVDALDGFDDRALVRDPSTVALRDRIVSVLADPPSADACIRYAAGFGWAEVARRTATQYDTAGVGA